MAVDRCYPTFAIELENTPQAAISTKACENLGEGCVARSDSASGALVVQGTLKSESLSSLFYRLRGKCGVESGGMGRGGGRAELGRGVGCSRGNTKWHILT